VKWTALLHANAGGYARLALANITREFPSDVRHLMTALQRPRRLAA